MKPSQWKGVCLHRQLLAYIKLTLDNVIYELSDGRHGMSSVAVGQEMLLRVEKKMRGF